MTFGHIGLEACKTPANGQPFQLQTPCAALAVCADPKLQSDAHPRVTVWQEEGTAIPRLNRLEANGNRALSPLAASACRNI